MDTTSAAHDLVATLRGAPLEVKHRLPLGSDLVAATLALALPGIVAGLWLAPRAAIPTEMPPLVLRADEIRASIATEHALASRVPEDEHTERRRALYEEQNLAELRGEAREVGERRRAALRAELAAIEAEHGAGAIDALRAADVERMIPALAGEGDDATRAAAIGGFSTALERWGVIVDGRRVAPELVVRALFAARWNAVHGEPLTADLDPVRLRAYHGWLALRGDMADGALRASALDAYEEAGGRHADEARGVLAWRAGAYDEAEGAFARAHARDGEVRMRNHALAASMAAAGPSD